VLTLQKRNPVDAVTFSMTATCRINTIHDLDKTVINLPPLMHYTVSAGFQMFTAKIQQTLILN